MFSLAHFWFVSNSAWFCGLVQISEMIFPQNGVRFIAINDGVDSAQGENDFAPLRNIFKNTRHLGGVNC